jgi:hypothetical protein
MRRLALLFCVAAATALAAPLASADANSVSPECNGVSCGSWFNTSVLLHWDISPDPNPPGCPDQTVSSEGVNHLFCDLTWPDTSTAHQAVDVSIDLTPPAFTVSPGPDQNGWYNHPVALALGGESDALSGIGSCGDPQPYSGPDGANVNIGGGCTDQAGNATPVVINYDATPPVVTGAVAGRSPDHNGWFNHPVAFSFRGSDGTSGIATCSSATYSGPDTSAASVAGTCADVAGNAGQGSQSFKYDATRPASADVQATPGNQRVKLTWTVPSDARRVSISRSEEAKSAASKRVYSGSGNSFTDKGLHNGSKYRYSVKDIDPAGNSSVKVIRAIPTTSTLRPYAGAVVSSPPLLTWKRVRGASYYNLQLYLGSKKLLSTWPRTASLQLKQSWHFGGKAYALAPGHYRWYVWPGFGSLSAHNYGSLIGRSSFRMAG